MASFCPHASPGDWKQTAGDSGHFGEAKPWLGGWTELFEFNVRPPLDSVLGEHNSNFTTVYGMVFITN